MKYDDLDLIALLVMLFVLVIAIVSSIVVHESKRNKRGLPEPHADTRDWTGAFMRDVKRHGR